MENKKFISYLSIGIGISMVISLAYFIYNNHSKNVVNYRLDDGYYYTGPMNKLRFDGRGSLITPDGIYQGNFSGGKFDGQGVFKAGSYDYEATFDSKSSNANISVTLIDGSTYEKVQGDWVEVDNNED